MTSKRAADSVFDHLRLSEVAAPSTPASGSAILYVKSDGRTYWKDDAGNEHQIAKVSELAAAGDIVDIPTAETDTALVLHPDGAGGVEWGTDATGGGGGGGGDPDVLGWTHYPYTSTNAASITIPAQASGTRILLPVSTRSNDVTSVSCTNVTWTEIIGWNSSTNTYMSLYLGVATGTTGTTITVNVGGTNYVFATAIYLGDALTPTTGDDDFYQGTVATGRRVARTIATSPGDMFAAVYTTADASQPITSLETSSPSFWVPDAPQDGLCGLHIRVGLAGADHVSGWYEGGSGANVIFGLVAFT